MAIATRKPEMVGTVWTASASLMDSSGKVIARCIDTPNAIAKALMEMPRAKVVKSLEGTHKREHWESRMKSWNVAKSGLIKLKQTWQESSRLQPSQLQAYADSITREYGVPRIGIAVTDRHLKGQAVYNTWKRKGEHQWHPKNIQIGDWDVVSAHPGEMIMRLVHELAHHIENTKHGSLAHSSRHGNLEDDIGLKLSRKLKETTEPPGMQVGHQSASLGVPMKVHTQKSTGKAVTASMESFAKLQEARAEAAPIIKKVEEAKDVLGTLSHEDATELIAGLDLRVNDLDRRIDEGKANLEAIKETLDPRIAKLTELIPTTKEGRSEITHITKGKYRKVWGKEPPDSIVTKGKVRWEYALDTIAQELHLEGRAQTEGKAPDEYLKGLIEDAKGTKELIRATVSEIKSDESTLKALGKLKDTIKARTAKVTTGPLLQKLAKAPRVKVTAKPKPTTRAKVILAGVAQALIDKTQAKRSATAIAIDRSLLAKQVVPIKQVETWAKQPNRFDIRGVDTPQRTRHLKKTKHNVRPSVSVGR